MTRAVVHRACHLCEASCGLTFEVEGDRIASVRNDPDDPFSRGFCCPKGLALARLHHAPDRLTTPLVRRADGTFAEASWPAALDRAAEGLAAVIARHGLDALGVYVGNPVVHNLGAMVGTEVFRALFPTRNRYSANSQDVNPHLLVNLLMFGMQLAQPVPDLDRTRWLLVVGANPLVSNGSLMTAPRVGARLRALRARGGTLVVVDPRRTETARLADEHLPLRPGADALLLLALAREVLAQGLEDRAFLGRWCQGHERLPALLAPFTPERVAPHLGLGEGAPATVRRLARALATTRPAAVYLRLGPCNTTTGGLAVWAGHLLNLLTGNVDRAGGVLFPEGPLSWLFRLRFARGSFDAYRSPQGRPELAGEYPCSILAEQVERGLADPAAPEALRALVVFAGNPVLSAPNGRRLARALDALECVVAVDTSLSATARHAHVVLPPRSVLHDGGCDPVFPHFAVEDVARWTPPVVAPPPGSVSEYEAIARLAQGVWRRAPRDPRRQGRLLGLLARAAPRLSPEALAALGLRLGPRRLSRARLAAHPHGHPARPLAEGRLARRLFTADGKVALAPGPLVADLDRLVATLAAPPAPGGLVLIGRRQLRTNNSWIHLPGPRCTLLVHPEDARARGLATGSRAVIASRVGEVQVEVEVTDDVSPGVVSLPHGRGHPSVNDLTDDARHDPLTGSSALNGVPVTLAPAAADLHPAGAESAADLVPGR
ncbi:MAG: molybdopterin-dependent oxidoreductase [Planctomycetes bacterium]|nr:molybdopterin-dependent oxidoreductase [Planctomycetota bacterium]